MAVHVDPLHLLQQSLFASTSTNFDPKDRLIHFDDFNATCSADETVGLFNKKGEELKLGDLWHLAVCSRQQYTFPFISERGFRYINVVERQLFLSLLQPPANNASEGSQSGCPPSRIPRIAAVKLRDPTAPLKLPQCLLLNSSQSLPSGGDSESSESRPSSSPCKHSSDSTNFPPQSDGLHTLAFLAPLSISLHHRGASLLKQAGESEYGEAAEREAAGITANGLVETWVLDRYSAPALRSHCEISLIHADFSRVASMAEVAFPRSRTTTRQRHAPLHSAGAAKIARRTGMSSVHSAAQASAAAVLNAPVRSASVLEEVLGRLKLRPIIIIPSSAGSAIVNKLNAIDFLQHGKFNECLSIATGEAGNANAKLEVTSIINGRSVKFRLIETSQLYRLSVKEWGAVVAAIVSSQEWQFRGWPFKDVHETFRAMKGFYFSFQDAGIPSSVRSWNVQVLQLHRTHRHNHAPVQSEFWKGLEAFLLGQRKRPTPDSALIDRV